MTAEEIKAIIKEELKSEPDLSNVSGYDLTGLLMEPKQQDYKDSIYHINSYPLWTVFEERKDGKGYYIYFDEKSRVFGLAVKSDSGIMIRIGDYGSFIKTIYTM